jgi:hypothetical protein
MSEKQSHYLKSNTKENTNERDKSSCTTYVVVRHERVARERGKCTLPQTNKREQHNREQHKREHE